MVLAINDFQREIFVLNSAIIRSVTFSNRIYHWLIPGVHGFWSGPVLYISLLSNRSTLYSSIKLLIFKKLLFTFNQSSECEFCKHVRDSIEGTTLSYLIKSQDMKQSPIPLAYIGLKDNILLSISSDIKSFYLGIEEDSFLFIDNIAIPLRKDFKWKKQFDDLQVYQNRFLLINKLNYFS